MRSREGDTLPRFISLPLSLFLWILFLLLLEALGLAWFYKVPVYVVGNGIVLAHEQQKGEQGALAAIFVPASQADKLRVGQVVLVRLQANAQPVRSQIEQVEEPLQSPDHLCRTYGLAAQCTTLIQQPSVAVLLRLNTFSARQYAGSLLTADIQVGTRSILSLFPGLGGFK
ncbi:hypothetical protein EI42_00414 [Thermosporothrix hazakensis]|uniref:Uncharacterized protein n=3 Tax=Thermosporothrix TaxID=768650 RepID=A0A326UEG9_THEHA|nr:hypothetical protein EI42_00414 [Thermosporothrix hazakensis]BBH88704.1 hypothetical protein KTC_34550 [Thermosporothrix sp. COM3]GCE46890.1 hypothetical protein KTH_17590 [Thermosporothrix hazakensis]